MAQDEIRFTAAQSVWPKGRERERNLFVGFRATVVPSSPRDACVRVAASAVYRLFVNGRFVGHGPARAAKGFFRVDEWPVRLDGGRNIIAVEVSAYNVQSYCMPSHPAFLQAEVVCDGRVLAATGSDESGFEAAILDERVRRVPRYSYQRAFSEAYRLSADAGRWRVDPNAAFDATACALQEPRPLLPRRVPYPAFHCRQPSVVTATGALEECEPPDEFARHPGMKQIGVKAEGFNEAECDAIPSFEIQSTRTTRREDLDTPYDPAEAMTLKAGEWRIVDFGVNLTGFVGLRTTCRKPTRLVVTFDEMLSEGDVNHVRLNCANIIAWDMPAGTFDLESVEPCTLRFAKVIALEGACDVADIRLREYVNPEAQRGRFSAADPRCVTLFEAARETAAQNAVDLFMDCPSRERAGWLCDSFWTARAMFALCGNASVEKAFLENFLLPESFPDLAPGMIPMCYPSDHPAKNWIPNWAMWFVVQLEEYLARTGDRELVDALRARVLGIVEYFKPFRNADGLLEKLESWVFIEWSKAGSFTQDVNYPSNMLFSGMLDAVARLYDLPECAEDAARVRETIRAQSFDGEFFVDNAVREDGTLAVTRNRTEVCQYYAFFFDVATPALHPELWRRLVTEFGPDREQTGAYPEIHPANAFIGLVLRMDVLSRYGEAAKVVGNLIGYYLPQAEMTGTLWEMLLTTASLNHGFASHIALVLYRDLLGLREVDWLGRRVVVRLGDVDLPWAEGRMPTPAGPVCLCWQRTGNRIEYALRPPAGWRVAVEAAQGVTLVRRP